MLRIVSYNRRISINDGAKVELIKSLDDAAQKAVVRAMRERCFELIGYTKEDTGNSPNIESQTSYVADSLSLSSHGEIFIASDHLLFLIFDDMRDELPKGEQALRAGCIVDISDAESAGTQVERASMLLERFCEQIDERLERLYLESSEQRVARQTDIDEEYVWRPDKDSIEFDAWSRARESIGLDANVEETSVDTDRKAPTLQTERAVDVLGDAEVRRWLRRLREARQDNRTRGDGNVLQPALTPVTNEAADKPNNELTTRMRDVGLLNAEIVVSCREAKRALFRLPSSAALAAITATNAVCSECGAMIGDEKIEELGAPTPFAFSLLDAGVWLNQHLRQLLKSYGVSETSEFIDLDRPEAADGEATIATSTTTRLLVNYCGELLLIVACDGDFNSAQAALALDSLIEFDVTRLLVCATGEITSDARTRLRSYNSSSRATYLPEIFFAERVPSIKAELQHALAHAAHTAIRRTLAPLNPDLGFPADTLVEERFRAGQMQTSDAEDTKRAAESNGSMLSDVVGAVAGRLSSF